MNEIIQYIEKSDKVFSEIKNISFPKGIKKRQVTEVAFPSLKCTNKVEIFGDLSNKKEKEKAEALIKQLNNPSIISMIQYYPGDLSEMYMEGVKDANGELHTFNCKQNQVMLINFWAWDDSSQQSMAHNEQIMLKNKEKWAGKAKIIAFNVDKEFDVFAKRIKENNWTKVEHYNYENEKELFDLFEKFSAPSVLLLNKEGIVKYRGVPSNLDFEVAINKLIENDDADIVEEEEEKEEVQASANANIEKEKKGNELKDRFDAIEKIHKFSLKPLLSSIINNEKQFQCSLYISTEIEENNEINTAMNAEIYIQLNTDEKCLQIINEIKELEKEIPNVGICRCIKIRYNYRDKCDIAYKKGITCSLCSKEISDTGLYCLCYLCLVQCKPFFICEACFNAKNTSPSEDIHEHPIVLVPKGGIEYLDKMEGFKEYQEKMDDDADNLWMFSCDNCEGKIQNCNWTCCVCSESDSGSYDLCDQCMKISLASEGGAQFKWGKEHKKEHPLMRIRKQWKCGIVKEI